MKIYLQMLKLNFKVMSKGFALYATMMLGLTIFRLFIIESNVPLFDMTNMTLSQMIFDIVFTMFQIFNITSIWMFLLMTFENNILQMIPKIREKSLIYSGIYLFGFFTWSVFICNFNEIDNLLFFAVANFWFISIFTSVFLYFFESKFSLLILPTLIFLTPFLFTYMGAYPNLIMVLEILYIILVIFQIKAFAKRYIHFKERANRKKGAVISYLDSYQLKLEATSMKNIVSILKTAKKSSDESKYIKLFNHYLFGYGLETFTIMVTIYAFMYGFLYGTVAVAGLKYGSLIIAALFLQSLLRKYKVFRVQNKIEHLYVVSKLSRDRFESSLLITVVRAYIKNSMFDIPFIVAGYIIYDKFYGNLDLMYLIILVLSCFFITLLTIYVSWYFTVRKRDYNMIKGSNYYSSV